MDLIFIFYGPQEQPPSPFISASSSARFWEEEVIKIFTFNNVQIDPQSAEQGIEKQAASREVSSLAGY